MKHTARLTALLLALILTASMLMAGCGQQTQESVSGTVSTSDKGESMASSKQESADAGIETGKTREPAKEEPAAPDDQPETAIPDDQPETDDGKPVSMGTLNETTYTNSYVGYGITLDENWSIYTADQLQTLPEDLAARFTEGTDFEGLDVEMFTDIMAENLDDLLSFNVLYQKQDMPSRLLYMALSEEEIVDMMIAETKDALIATYANAGIEVESVERTTATFLGEERAAMYTVASISGTPYYILQFIDPTLGQYSVTTTVASFVTDNTRELAEMFYPID